MQDSQVHIGDGANFWWLFSMQFPKATNKEHFRKVKVYKKLIFPEECLQESPFSTKSQQAISGILSKTSEIWDCVIGASLGIIWHFLYLLYSEEHLETYPAFMMKLFGENSLQLKGEDTVNSLY